MSKLERSSLLFASLRSYTSNSTLHGMRYISDLSLPLVDRLVWFVVVVMFGACAAFLSHGVFQAWQDNLVVTTLKETELPVTQLDFPAITICSEGLNMEAVEKVIETDYEEWKHRTKRNVPEDEPAGPKKYVLTMARYACNLHHGWRTQATRTYQRMICRSVTMFFPCINRLTELKHRYPVQLSMPRPV